MQYWLKNDLQDHLQGVNLSGALQRVEDMYRQLGWNDVRRGGSQLGALSFGEKLDLGHLALHVSHVIAHDVIHGAI